MRHPERVKNVYFYEVPRDKPGKYTVVLRVKSTAAVSTIVDKINVWVVWAHGSKMVTIPASTVRANGKTRIGEPANPTGALHAQVGYAFTFGIEPYGITDDTQDIPDLKYGLTADQSNSLPGANQNHPLFGDSLRDGANTKWDVSRKVAFSVTNPNSVSSQYFDSQYSLVFKGVAIPSGVIVPFPDTAALGNDDGNVDDEDNNPYQANTTGSVRDLWHIKGDVASHDIANLWLTDIVPAMSSSAAPNQAAIHMQLGFQEFLRLCIGSSWYEVSDPVPWQLMLDATLGNDGTWTATPNNP